ncbi:site-specific integrase [Kovacikia minuta CCNUW1]|uniref:site-specific integrase n=1 Tax=Kovacikia minuta TaxID=2931930 RepID=UPI001CCCC244|nr:site-specific integrase [Kovacikia minuta]UBF26426.1 site-specific integrase [Kovacikia minuta CCNUW1]
MTQNKRGSIQIVSRSDRLYLHFTTSGQRYRFSLDLNKTKAGMKKAQTIANTIELDIISGNFDPGLDKYRDKPRAVTTPTVGEKKGKTVYKTSRKQNRLPFSPEEIELILNALQTNQFCSKFSAFKHSHYVPFVSTAFLLGLRNAELIGLQVKHCDFDRRTVEISSTLARTKNCTNAKARVRKSTKTGNIRFLPMSDRLYDILLTQCQGKGKEDLIFTSHKGLAIDDKTLQKRVLKPILKALGLAERDLYAARHSFGSRAIEQGIPVNQVSALMGHSNIETTMRNYIHNRMPDKLPDL